MEQFKHRHNARIVAYIECVLSVIQVISLGVIFMAAVWFSFVVPNHQKKWTENDLSGLHIVSTVLVAALWIGVAVGSVITAINIWATSHLLRATKQGADTKQALRSCKIWQCVTVICLILSTLGFLSQANLQSSIMCLLNLTFRGVFLYIVNNFIREIQANEPTYTGERKKVMSSQRKPPPYTAVVMD